MRGGFDVTGMSCAACSARVTRAVKKVAGVRDVNVNLLKNSMEVEWDEKVTNPAAICAAVVDAGYGANPKGAAPAAADAGGESAADRERETLFKRLIISIILSVPLMYLSMAPMLDWPLPFGLGDHDQMPILALTELLFTLPVAFVNFKFFRNGFKSLISGGPTMDALVAIGSGASIVYGIACLYLMLAAQASGDMVSLMRYGHNLYFDGAAMILTLVTLGKFFEARAKGRTTDAITKLMKLAPPNAVVEKNGAEVTVPLAQVVVGDIVVIRTGGKVPVDGTVVTGSGSADEAAITGESLPVEKEVGDHVTAGTLLSSGFVRVRADKVGGDTVLSQIIHLVDEATSSKAPIARLADRVAGIFVPVVIGIALLTLVVWLLVGESLSFALTAAISVLVISCPCALGLATPTAIMVGTGRGAAAGILFKSASALEETGKINTVVLDKTGTVTKGRPVLTAVLPADTGHSQDDLLRLAAAVESLSEHPLAKAVVQAAQAKSLILPKAENFSQVPGAVQAVVEGHTMRIGNARIFGADLPVALRQEGEQLAQQGATPLYCFIDGKPAGVLAAADEVKPESAKAIDLLTKMGVSVVLLTGDNEAAAHAVAAKVGIKEVIAGVLPQGKEAEIRRLQSQGRKVMMVGDGINDAPALARADLGMAIGAGTDVAIASADIVLMKSRLTDVPAALALGRAVMRNIKENLFWAFFYNAVGIPVAAGVFYVAFGWLLNPMIAAAAMSCSSVSVVSNALRLRFWKSPAGEEPVPAAKPTAACACSAQPAKADAPQASAKPLPANLEKRWVPAKGMMCGHCTARVEKNLLGVPGVHEAKADLKAQNACVACEASVTDAALQKAVEDAGYKTGEVRHDTAAPEKTPVKADVALEKRTVPAKGMMCGHCTARVEKNLLGVPGVHEAKADLKGQCAYVTCEALVSDESLAKAVVDAGYKTGPVLHGEHKAVASTPAPAQASAPLQERTVPAKGMMCGHCTARVEKELLAVPGVKSAKADLKAQSARVQCEGSVTDQSLQDAVVKAGYKTGPVQHAQDEEHLVLEKRVLPVKAMTSEECEKAVEEHLLQVPGVRFARGDLEKHSVTVMCDAKVSDTDLRQAVEDAGYHSGSVDHLTA